MKATIANFSFVLTGGEMDTVMVKRHFPDATDDEIRDGIGSTIQKRAKGIIVWHCHGECDV